MSQNQTSSSKARTQTPGSFLSRKALLSLKCSFLSSFATWNFLNISVFQGSMFIFFLFYSFVFLGQEGSFEKQRNSWTLLEKCPEHPETQLCVTAEVHEILRAHSWGTHSLHAPVGGLACSQRKCPGQGIPSLRPFPKKQKFKAGVHKPSIWL